MEGTMLHEIVKHCSPHKHFLIRQLGTRINYLVDVIILAYE